jgi:hypothetical protein
LCDKGGLHVAGPYDIMLSCSSSYFITWFSWFSCVQFDLGWIKCMCNIIGIFLVRSSNQKGLQNKMMHIMIWSIKGILCTKASFIHTQGEG